MNDEAKRVVEEEWRPIPGWETRYEVSNLGAVRRTNGQALNPWPNHDGYMLVRLTKLPRRVIYRVHRLVALAFIPNPGGKPSINHLDHCRQNNRAGNLEWCTQKENLVHADLAGRLQKDYWKGKRAPNAKLTDAQVRDIRQRYSEGGITHSELATAYNMSKGCMGRVISGKTYTDVSLPAPPEKP